MNIIKEVLEGKSVRDIITQRDMIVEASEDDEEEGEEENEEEEEEEGE